VRRDKPRYDKPGHDAPRHEAPRHDTARRDAPRHDGPRGKGAPHASKPPGKERARAGAPSQGQVRYRLEVGHNHGVQPGNIVGAIANEAGIDSAHIGRIEIFDAYSTVDLPEGMPKEVYNQLRKAWVCGQKLDISVPPAPKGGASRPPRAR
jgi:ATP-dependent RNA helicase DeaD